MTRLITIPISHYCEKARWALDRAGVPYREERHVQGIHMLASRRAGGKGTVPVLVTPQGAIAESEEILAWADRGMPEVSRLFPAGPELRAGVESVSRRFDAELGPRGRRLMYLHMLAIPELALPYNNAGVPAWEAVTIRAGWPLAKAFVSRKLGVRPSVEAQDEAAVWRELDFAAGLLADGRPFLCGERFTAADLTFASLAASVTFPPGYGVPLPDPNGLPAATASLVRRAREHPAGNYAMRLFAERRGERVAVSSGD